MGPHDVSSLRRRNMVIRRLARRLPAPIAAAVRHVRRRAFWSPYSRVSYSQEGEDLLVERYFEHRGAGFYVDVGAHHPHRFSNTQLLYERGWSGINIDGAPGSMAAFERMRPRDVNLELLISDQPGEHDFFVFDEPALNSMSSGLSSSRERDTAYSVSEIVSVHSMTLADVLRERARGVQKIDLLTIDVEGHDLQVLRSNNWDEFRPEAVLVEVLETRLGDLLDEPAVAFLVSLGYDVYAKLVRTVMLVDSRAEPTNRPSDAGCVRRGVDR